MGVTAAVAGVASAAAGIGGQIAGGGGGGGGGGGDPLQPYQLGNTTGADQNYGGALSAFPAYTGAITNAVTGSPGALAQQGANTAGAIGTNTVSPMEISGASQLQQMGNAGAPFGQQILDTGFDPQNALYNRTQQQVLDQLNATNAQQGLSGTPYGAGVVGQNLSNFNIDWQNQQLGRQATAAQGYNTLGQGVGRDFSGAAALGEQGVSDLSAFSSLPLNATNAINSDAMQALLQQAGLSATYLGLSNSFDQTALTAQNQGFNQSQQLGAGLGSSLQALSGLFGSSPPALSSVQGGGSGQTYAPSSDFYSY